MTGTLEGKVAIVTGGTSGIGARTVALFVAEGARVAFAGRSAEKGARLAGELGENALFVRTDVSKESDIEALVARTVGQFGRLDCMFNNAGYPGPTEAIADLAWDDYSHAMDVLLGGVVMGMKHAAKVMQRQGSGSIINNASVAAVRTGYGPHIYTAAKAAVLHLTRSVAMELGEQGIRVNSISPGAIMTPIFGKALGMETSAADATVDKLEQPFTTLQPLPRSGKPADIANAALFLASDAASFINGHDLVVDGGMIGGRGWTESVEGFGALADALGLSNP